MYTLEGSWGWQVVDELQPENTDQYLNIWKPRASAFIATNFDLLLRNRGIKTLIMTGVVTEGCVESTTRDAGHLDYYTVTIKDCVDTDDKVDHEASLRHAAKKHPVMTSHELIQIWKTNFSP
jgi:nicotinamidase-related amidase